MALSVAPPFPGAALRVMRTAAGRRALQLGLLVSGLFALGALGGQQAQAADTASPAPVGVVRPAPAGVVRPVHGTVESLREGADSAGSRVEHAVRSALGEAAGHSDRGAHSSGRPQPAAPTGRPGPTVTDRGLRPATDPLAHPATDVRARPATDALVRPVTDHVLRPVTVAAVRPVAQTVRPVTQTVRPVTRVVRPLGDLVGTVVGTVVEGLDEAPVQLPELPAQPPLPSLPCFPSVPSLPSVPSVPSLPSVPGVPQTPESPESPGLPGAGQALPAPDSPQEPDTTATPRPDTAGHGAGAANAGPALAYGPGPAWTGAAAEDAHGRHRQHPHAVAVRTAQTRPSHQAPGRDPADALADRSAADSGAPRHGDPHAAVTPDHRAPLRLVPGAAATVTAAGTRDRHRDIREFPG
ncbi:hypothetical protein ACFYP4_23615 [Streptomyces sp. NPDC005551]|uniref:hypothetical protein n=1 Tax=Streptomyces sp. NPDC005551 TaxID=3364725 RepID=UPI0036C23F36